MPSPGAPAVSVIIVNWKSGDWIRRCLVSLRRCEPGADAEVVVVDNASGDGCQEMLAREFPEVRFAGLNRNAGFAGANNEGARLARGRSLLFLNPDTEFLGRALQPLDEALWRLPAAGALGCRLLNADGSLQTSCVQAFPTVLNQLLDAEFLRRLFPQAALWGTQALRDANPDCDEVEVVSGACLMMKRDVFAALGGFSEDYFMYAEDTDLCFRARAAGLRNYYVPSIRITHFGGGSSRQRPETAFHAVTMRKSLGLYFRKHHGAVAHAAYRLAMVANAVVRLGLLALALPVFLARREGRHWKAVCGKWWAIGAWALGARAAP